MLFVAALLQALAVLSGAFLYNPPSNYEVAYSRVYSTGYALTPMREKPMPPVYYLPETTTADPCPTTTTTNGYEAMGWKTDDDGNVFVGDDNAKFYLISLPSNKFWKPIPKDWPEGPMFGSMFPDSPYYRGVRTGSYNCACGGCG